MKSQKIGVEFQTKNNISNILTIDVEDWFHILDLPSLPPLKTWVKLESRVVSNTIFILDLLDKYKTKGTFFVLGWVAKHFPDLVREIEKRGHEIGSHGYSHELIYHLTQDRFRRDVSLSLEYLSRITSRPILGYRAPGFSIVPETLYALDILVELGFYYDASIFPMKRNHGGFPGFSEEENWITTPRGNRILEIPVTPINWLGKKIYLFGGGYFRLAPYPLIEQAITYLNDRGKSVLVYLHPREFDVNHPRLAMSLTRSFTTYVNLEQTRSKFERAIAQFKFSSIEKIWKLFSSDSQLIAS
ncbi:polysaccharide deactylase family protein, PEP-CTERM locus subfamily [Pleurocapsa sp. PCC 7327]|uniref:XrtA system polysaccharide deacetylase n=1 Tax=Pleurocapsa sp. PCC 7327 TaxID=118163 RepID=UPI00029FFF90|nr:XrtA system polysaccharide deacetylase [Pleurocapsa sp. PCC 7327]AFY78056.1 polysaccharide deactylase family protein, PEP-CTERM locus subfamily [Pleurocapsa sp. PCC 7327]